MSGPESFAKPLTLTADPPNDPPTRAHPVPREGREMNENDLRTRPVTQKTWENGAWTVSTFLPGTPEHDEFVAFMLSDEDEF